MANRHKSKSGVQNATPYNAMGSNVLKEAKERKRGGRAESKVSGEKAMKRMDKRARGGRAGADKSPFSSAGAGLRGG